MVHQAFEVVNARPNAQGLAAMLRALANATGIEAGSDSETQKKLRTCTRAARSATTRC